MSPLYLITILGGIFLLGSLISFLDSRFKVRHCSEQVVGKVAQVVVRERVVRKIESIKEKDANRHLLCSPVIAYQAGDEEVEEIYFRASRPCPYNVGDEVKIRYNPSRPHSYIIDGDGSFDAIAIAFAVAGLLLVACSVFLAAQMH